MGPCCRVPSLTRMRQFGFSGISGWEREEGAGETLACWSHITPATSSSTVPHPASWGLLPMRTRTSIPTPPTLSPSRDGGEETKKGLYGWPCVHDPAEDYAQPPQPPCPQTAPQPLGCPYSQLCSSLYHIPYPIKPPKNMAWAWHRAHIPWPPTCPNTVLEQNPTEAPASTSPAPQPHHCEGCG